jgi:signal transduction histidine kinase
MEITDHPNAVPDIPQYVKTKTEQVRRRLEAVARLNRVAFDILDTNAKNTLREWGAVALSNRIVSYPLAMAGYQGKKHILVENTCARGVRLQADARWLSRAVLNLSTNALRAIPDSGGVVRVRTATHKNAFVVTVSDTGPGMNAAQKAKFRNRARFSTQAGDGHGIGSSVVHQAVELHGGKVEVSDNVPHGTVFELSIPIKR